MDYSKMNNDLQAVSKVKEAGMGDEAKPVKVPMLKYLNERVLKNRFQ